MTELYEAKDAVYKRFLANYPSTLPATQITFDNDEFDEPDTDPWVRLVVRSTAREQSTLGKASNRRFRSTASVFIQVYTQVNTGVKLNSQLAKAAADVFEGFSFSGLDFTSAVVRETGPSGKWYQSVVEAEFEYDEIK